MNYRSAILGDITDITHGFGAAGVELAQYVDGAWYPQTHQVHGTTVHVLGDGVNSLRTKPGSGTQHHPSASDDVDASPPLQGDAPNRMVRGDAFITAEPKIVCFVRTADCVPILVADPVRRVVGAIHAGWRGTAADVAGAAVRAMNKRFGCDAKDIRAAIGPAICGDCYDVGEDVIHVFESEGLSVNHWARFDEDATRLDLVHANRDLLIRAGLDESHVETISVCTSCGGGPLASYRRDRSDVRQVSFIMVNSER